MALTKVHNRMVAGASVSVLDYGAVGNGTTDDTAAIQAAFNSGAKAVNIPSGTYLVTALTITSAIKIYGEGKLLRNAVASSYIITVTANDVTIDGIEFEGDGAGSTIATTDILEGAIVVNGTNSSSPAENCNIRNCKINGFAGYGIRMNYTRDCRIENCDIEYCGYAGILCLSTVDSTVTQNRIKNIDSSAGSTNWYGISVTRDPNQTEANSARPTNCIISHNIISNVNQWAGIDTHAALKCTISDNNVYYCKFGIYTQYDDASATYKQPAEDVIIANNLVQGRATSSETELGIASLGLSGMPNKRISILGNTLIDCGSHSSANGALYINHTDYAEVKNNVAEKCVRVGIGIAGESRYCTIRGNKVNGVKAGASAGFYVYEDHTNLTDIIFADNVFVNTTGDSNYTPSIGIFYVTGGNEVIHSKNRIYTLSGVNYIQKTGPTNNVYTDLAWELEAETIQFNYTTTGGAATESLGSKVSSFRRVPNTSGTFIYRIFVSFDNLTTDPKIAIRGNNGSIYTPLIYTVDGTNIGASKAINNVNYRLEGIYWVD